jgi:putative transcriptional regulator
MKENDTIKVRILNDGTKVQVMEDGSIKPIKKNITNWDLVNSLTEDQIKTSALNDKDNPLLTKQELENLQRIPDLKNIRNKLNMTQEQFAKSFSLPLGTIRDWEQGAKYPDTAARILLRVIARNPQAVLHALKTQ